MESGGSSGAHCVGSERRLPGQVGFVVEPGASPGAWVGGLEHTMAQTNLCTLTSTGAALPRNPRHLARVYMYRRTVWLPRDLSIRLSHFRIKKLAFPLSSPSCLQEKCLS